MGKGGDCFPALLTLARAETVPTAETPPEGHPLARTPSQAVGSRDCLSSRNKATKPPFYFPGLRSSPETQPASEPLALPAGTAAPTVLLLLGLCPFTAAVSAIGEEASPQGSLFHQSQLFRSPKSRGLFLCRKILAAFLMGYVTEHRSRSTLCHLRGHTPDERHGAADAPPARGFSFATKDTETIGGIWNEVCTVFICECHVHVNFLISVTVLRSTHKSMAWFLENTLSVLGEKGRQVCNLLSNGLENSEYKEKKKDKANAIKC